MIKTPIPVFILNLKKRTERKKSILKEFEGKSEFTFKVVEPLMCDNAAESLWMTLKYIIQNMVKNEDEMFIFCEDDHQFTVAYSKDLLLKCINQAREANCDILSGGVSCVKSTFKISPELFWMEEFTGLQFVIIFRRFFQSIIDFKFASGNDADIVISKIADRKVLIFPFISTQKEFGYSDVTNLNNTRGRVKELFAKSAERIISLNNVNHFYHELCINELAGLNYEEFQFPTYIFYNPETPDRLDELKEQFINRKEFELFIINVPGYQTNRERYFTQVQKIIKVSADNDDDVIIICNDQHLFTEHYSKIFFIQNIIQAHQQGANLLLGNLKEFDSALKLSECRFWISSFLKSDFIVVFSKFFPVILAETYSVQDLSQDLLSELTSNKMVLFPFISSNAGVAHIEDNASSSFARPIAIGQRFHRIHNAHLKFTQFI